ncbi:hypothetical protein ES705_24983 [subsurface metagenome]
MTAIRHRQNSLRRVYAGRPGDYSTVRRRGASWVLCITGGGHHPDKPRWADAAAEQARASPGREIGLALALRIGSRPKPPVACRPAARGSGRRASSAARGKNRAPDNRPRPGARFLHWRRPSVAIPHSEARSAAFNLRPRYPDTPKSNTEPTTRFPPPPILRYTPTFLDTIHCFCENVVFYPKCDQSGVRADKKNITMSQNNCRFSY